MLDSKGNEIHFGQFWDHANRKWAKIEQAKGVTPGIGLYPKLIDWDQDGDLDLLVGNRRGSVGLRINEGDKQTPKFAATNQFIKVGEKYINYGFHASIDMADLNGDKLPDLVVASTKGVFVHRNVGTPKAPKFEAGVSISTTFADRYPCVTIADLNGDSKPDILVGGKAQRKHGYWLYKQK